jgi:hypothetical protein
MRGLFTRRRVLVFDRLTNLADGIFGVAMTFLAFTIQHPAAGEGPDGGLAVVAQFSAWLAIVCRPGLVLPGHALSRWLSLRLALAGPTAQAAEPDG